MNARQGVSGRRGVPVLGPLLDVPVLGPLDVPGLGPLDVPGLRRSAVSLATGVESVGALGTAVESVGALAVVTGVAAGAFYLYGRRCRGHPDATGAMSRLRRAFRVGLPLVYLLALGAMAAVGWLDLLSALARGLPGSAAGVGGSVAAVLGLALPSVAVVGAYLGALPAIRSVRDVDVATRTVVARLARYAGGLVVVLAALGAGTGVVTSGAGDGFLLAVAGLLLLAWVGSPWLVRFLQSTRAPTDAERERLARLCGDVGLAPRTVRVLDAAGAKRAHAVLRGVPGRRQLFVADSLLDELDDDRLRAFLAVQAGRASAWHLEVKLLAVTGTLALPVALLAGYVSVPGVPDGAVAIGVGGGVTALWLGQRLVYRADAYAVAATDSETVEATLRAFADSNAVPMDWGRLTALRRMEPPLVRRIDRLRDRAASE